MLVRHFEYREQSSSKERSQSVFFWKSIFLNLKTVSPCKNVHIFRNLSFKIHGLIIKTKLIFLLRATLNKKDKPLL